MPREHIPPEAFLASLPLFKALDPATLARLAASTTRRALRRGEILFRKGEPSTGMYVVAYGEIKLISTTPAKGERLSGVVGPGQSFGEPVMFLERATVLQAQAASDALVLHVPKEALFAEIERSPKFARRMLAGLSRRIESLVRELDRQASGTATERLAAYLLRLGKGKTDFTVTLPAAKSEVASQLNLTPEHFSRVLRELVDAGVLQVKGRRITVPDVNKLRPATRKP